MSKCVLRILQAAFAYEHKPKEYSNKFRQLVFNLKKNDNLRANVVGRTIDATELIAMQARPPNGATTVCLGAAAGPPGGWLAGVGAVVSVRVRVDLSAAHAAIRVPSSPDRRCVGVSRDDARAALSPSTPSLLAPPLAFVSTREKPSQRH